MGIINRYSKSNHSAYSIKEVTFLVVTEYFKVFNVHLHKILDTENNCWVCSTAKKTDAMLLLKLMKEAGIQEVDSQIYHQLQLTGDVWELKINNVNNIQEKLEKISGFKEWLVKN